MVLFCCSWPGRQLGWAKLSVVTACALQVPPALLNPHWFLLPDCAQGFLHGSLC